MGRKSRLNKKNKPNAATPNYREGERIWIKDALGFFPEGIYTFRRKESGFLTLDAGSALVGISEVALEYSRRLRPDEANLPGVTEQEIANHNLAISRSAGKADCPHCLELASRLN